jgi:hypothetical protein
MAIALKLGTDGHLYQLGDSEALQADAFERKQSSGDLLVGSTLGAAEELQLGSSSATVRAMGDARVDGYIELIDTSAPGNPLDGEGRLYKKTGNDGLFWIPDSGGSEVDLTSGGGMSEATHLALDTLVHELAEDYYEEYTYSGSEISNVTVWTNSGKTLKIREYTYTYNPNHTVNVETVKQYDSGGSLLVTLTYTYAYSGTRISSITCVRS